MSVRDRPFAPGRGDSRRHKDGEDEDQLDHDDRITCYHGNSGMATDRGLGGRVHADLAWAKLRTLAEGARLASKSLWP